MKTLFNALRAAIFGAGFIFLWGWVALEVHRRYDDTLGFALAGWTTALSSAGPYWRTPGTGSSWPT